MKMKSIYLILLGLALAGSSVQGADLVTPGAGFIFDMEALVALNDSYGYDTLIKEATDANGDGYIDYFIKDLIRVSASDLLSIYPGERLVFRPVPASPSETLTPSLDVRGRLMAEGEMEGDIVFTSLAAYLAPDATSITPTLPFANEYSPANLSVESEGFDTSLLTDDMMVYQGVLGITVATGAAPGQWDSIGFVNPTGKSVLRYVTIEYADIGVNCQSVASGRLDIERCTIHDNYTGVFLSNSTPRIVENYHISQNHLLYDTGGRAIRQTGTGIYISGLSQPLIRENVFEGNEGNSITISGTLVGTLPKLGNILNTENGTNLGLNTFRIAYELNSKGKLVPIGQNHIFNETPNTIYAQHNAWGETDPSLIDSEWLYDDDESPNSGKVIFSPYAYRVRTGLESGSWADYR